MGFGSWWRGKSFVCSDWAFCGHFEEDRERERVSEHAHNQTLFGKHIKLSVVLCYTVWFSWTQWLQLYIADCLIKITQIYHCIFFYCFAFKHYCTFIQPSSLVLRSCPVVTVTASCSHFKAKLSTDVDWLSSDFTVHDVFVSPLVISSCLWLIQAGTQLPDWMHRSEENSDFHTFNHVCASVRKEKKNLSVQQHSSKFICAFLQCYTQKDQYTPVIWRKEAPETNYSRLEKERRLPLISPS